MLKSVSRGDKMACSGDRKKSIWLGHTEMEKEGWGRGEAGGGRACMILRPKELGLKFILRKRGAH